MNLQNGSVCIVTEVDPVNMKAKVMWPTDEVVSNWLHILAFKGWYNIPGINEQVACVFDEEYNQGVIIGSVIIDGDGPYTDQAVLGLKLANIEIKIEKATGKVTVISQDVINVKADKITLEAEEVSITNKLKVGGTSEFTGNMTAKAKIDATGSVTTALNVVVGAGLTVSGISTLNGNVSSAGNIKAEAVIVKNANVSEDLAVFGKSEFTGNVSAKAKIDAIGIIKSTTDVQTATVKLNTHLHVSAAPTTPTSPPVPGT